MAALITIDENPLREQLHAKLRALSAELQTLERQIETYFNRDLPLYQFWVSTHFAEKVSEIQSLEKRLRELSADVEHTLQMSMQMDVDPSELFEELAQQGFYADKEKLREEEPREGSLFTQTPQTKMSANPAAKEAYRRIIRCLHPDGRGYPLTEPEKDLWVRVQRAYGKNDVCELRRLEQSLQCAEPTAGIAYSELLEQASELAARCDRLRDEMLVLRNEKAWNFSATKNVEGVVREVAVELEAALKELKHKQTHFHKTLKAWGVPSGNRHSAPAPAPKPRRKASKQQASLFDS